MTFVLAFVGLVLGAAIGDVVGAILGCLGGGWLGFWIKSQSTSAASKPAQDASAEWAPPAPDALDSLRDEVHSLRRRVESLERQRAAATPAAATATTVQAPTPASEAPALATLEPAPIIQAPAPAPAPSATPASEDWPVTQPPVVLPLVQAAQARAGAAAVPEPSLIARLFSGNIVAKVGVVVLFIGVGFLLKLAYDRGLMPPQLRLAAVALAAVAMFVGGQWLRDSRRLYGLILQGGASGLAYLDVFFALKTYGFIGPGLGFSLFALLGVATTFVAVRQDSRSLAVLGLGGAFLAPVLASTGGGSHVMLFSYYLLLNLFILGVSWFRAWRELNLTGWFFTFAIGLFWGAANYRPELFASVEPFVLAFFAIYLVVPILFALRQAPQLKGLVDGTLVFGTPAAVAFMQAALVKDMPYGLAWSAAVGAALYALLATLTWRRDNMRLLAETYAALALGLGTLAVFFAFDAYPTFAFWTIEGAAILWVGLRQDRPLARAFAILVQLAGAGLFLSEYGQALRPHPVFNDLIVGCLLIALASGISARLLQRHAQSLREWESLFGPGMLLWGALWWSVGGLDAMHHGLAREAVPTAAALFFLVSLAAAEFAGRHLSWPAMRHLASFHPLVLAAVLVAQFLLHQHPLAGLGVIAWPLGLALAFWTLKRQENDGLALWPVPRYLALWSILALAASWEQIWLHGEREHLLGMLLALAGHLAAYLRYHWREREDAQANPASAAVLLWSMAFWFGHGLSWMDARWEQALVVAAMLGLVAASALLYEVIGRALAWRGLRLAANLLWPAMALAALTHFGAGHPFASFGWLSWPGAFVVAYLAIYWQERDGMGFMPALGHAMGLWLAVVVASLELSWWTSQWKMGSAWQSSVWAFCCAAAMLWAVAWGNRGKWPVAPLRELYRGLVLVPLGIFCVAWALFANFKDPGSMAPLPYLPLLNPIDAMVGMSLAALWLWSRWFIQPDDETPGPLRKIAAALAFIWLNGIALRTIHFWAGVPYEFALLYRSVLVQATLSLLWAGAAMALMVLARRRMQRPLWIAGAVLLGAVVAKLFLVDLANSGTVERIVSFIGVGALLLGIGYVAPVPPGEEAEKKT